MCLVVPMVNQDLIRGLCLDKQSKHKGDEDDFLGI